MVRTMGRHYQNESGGTLLEFSGALPPRFFGDVAYIGELFVHPDNRGSLKRLRYFMILLQSCIATKWKVDWVYAMMRDRDVKRGFAANYGFQYNCLAWCAGLGHSRTGRARRYGVAGGAVGGSSGTYDEALCEITRESVNNSEHCWPCQASAKAELHRDIVTGQE